MGRKSYIILSLFVILFSSCGKDCHGKIERERQKIAINIRNNPSTLHPQRVRSLSDVNLAKMFNEGLTRIGEDGVSHLAIAHEITLSEDKRVYRITLKDTYWSNGDKVEAQDFVSAWRMALSPSYPSDNSFLLYPMKNAKAIKEGKLPSTLLGAMVVDEKTVEIHLEKPVPYFLELTSLPIYFPCHRKNSEDFIAGSSEPKERISNGPFLLDEWKQNDEMVAIRNPLYWDKQKVRLDEIKMIMVDNDTGLKMFEDGQLHWEGSPFSTLPLDSIAHLEDRNLVSNDPVLGTYWIRTNINLYPLHSQNIRRALSSAIDRDAIVEHVTNNSQIAATGIVPATLGLSSISYFGEEVGNDAHRFLAAAEKEDAISLKQLKKLTLTYVADARNHRIAQAVQDQWKKSLNLKVSLEALEPKVYFDRISRGDFQLACGSWIADFNDPINFLEVFKSKNIGTNNTGWESINYTKAIEESYFATTVEERTQQMREAEEIIMNEMPVLPIFHYNMQHVKTNKLKGVVLTGCGHIDFKEAYLVLGDPDE